MKKALVGVLLLPFIVAGFLWTFAVAGFEAGKTLAALFLEGLE